MTTLDATTLLRQALQTKLGIDAGRIRTVDTFASLGIDSLSGLEVLFDVEERLGIQLPSELVSLDCTLAELAARLESYLSDTSSLA